MSTFKGISISTHVLDTARGAPAADVGVVLDRMEPDGSATTVAKGRTDADGRVALAGPQGGETNIRIGAPTIFRLRFATESYLTSNGQQAFYPEITIVFRADPADPRQHYHVPLLLNPYGYTTYRGS